MSKAWNIPMLVHDWNAGATSTQLAKKYGFSSANSCNDRISKWRADGWAFQYKTDELTDSEATTAGTILQGGVNDG